MKLVEVPKAWGVTTPRANSNQNLGVTILDGTRISIKDNMTTRISDLSSGK
jgi:hypothetical protein